MFNRLIAKLERSLSPDAGGDGHWSDSIERELELAAATLLVEMSRADDEVVAAEREAVVAAIREAFDLPADEAEALHERATDRAAEAVSLYEFTKLLNERLDDARKEHVVELLWRVAVADGDIDRYEEHLVRRLADLLHVPHTRFIKTKHRAMEAAARG